MRMIFTPALRRRLYPFALWVGSCAACGSGGDEPSRSELPNFSGPPGRGSAGASGTPNEMAPDNGIGAMGAGAATSNGASGDGPGLDRGEEPNPNPDSGLTSPLPRSTPEAEGVRSEGLLAFVSALDQQIDEVHSVMVVRHGKVVLEAFWAPYTPEDIHVTYSVSKSFNATAVGLAIDEGLLGLDDLLVERFSDLVPAAPSPNLTSMRVRHLLMMGTGHTFDTMDTLRARSDGQWTRAFFETTVQNPPGTNFLYNSGAAYVLSSLVQRVTGLTVEEYLRPRLFEPLGIEATLWGKSPEGVNMGDGGLSVRTEDLAKFGLLYLQGGSWNGQQLLPAEWVAEATSSQISNGNRDSDWGYGYGFQFWQNSAGGFRADGSLGQFSIVLPEQDVVVAITSATNSTDRVMALTWQNLIPALGEPALPEDPAALAALESALQGLSLAPPAGVATSPESASLSGSRYVMSSNAQGIAAMSLDFSAAPAVLTIEDADGPHAIGIGIESWARGRTGFRKRINELFDTPEQGIAARGAWSAPDTFEARLVFNETPYTMILRFRFAGEQLVVDTSYNVRWGSSTEPQLTGVR